MKLIQQAWLLAMVAVFTGQCFSQTGSCADHIVVVGVTHRHAQPWSVSAGELAELFANDFRVNGSKVIVRGAEYHGEVSRVVILLDVGPKTGTEFDSEVTTAAALAQELPSNTELDLVTFTNKVEQKFAFQTDRGKFLAVLKSLTAIEHTSTEHGLLGAISDGAGFLVPYHHPGDAEIFLSSAPTAGHHKDKDEQQRLAQLLSNSAIRLFGVSLGQTLPVPIIIGGKPHESVPLWSRVPSNVQGDPGLFSSSEILSYESGGLVLSASGEKLSVPPAKDPAAESLANLVSHFYLLGLGIADSDKTENLKIELKDKQVRNAIRLWYPTRLYPCAAP